MSVLLTEDAIRFAASEIRDAETAGVGIIALTATGQAKEALNGFLRFHATEGRGALVERVLDVLLPRLIHDWPTKIAMGDTEPFRAWWRPTAEAIVTDLFGDGP